MRVVGDRGAVLDDVWAGGPFAYMTLAVPDFPNLFMLNGPNGPVGNFSLIEVAELQMAYVLQMMKRARAAPMSPSRAATARFDAERRQAATTTIWNTGCKSWYLDASGLPTAWPFTFDRFRAEMAQPQFADWVVSDGA